MTRVRTALAVFLLLFLSGCAGQPAQVSTTIFAMDTVMSLSVYGGGGQEALDKAVARIYELERLFSVTLEDSDLYRLNHAGGDWVEVSQETFDLLTLALGWCRETGGALDITAYPAVRAWGFIAADSAAQSREPAPGENRVPDDRELAQLAAGIDYTQVELDEAGCRARLPQGMELDLGAIAKGWTGSELARLLEEAGVTCAILRLGGNIQTLGTRPDGAPWRVGIQDPDGAEGTYLAVLETADQAVITSGGYQRYFEQDGQTYWHILDPDTAAPARTGLSSVTVVGDRGADCDALSTALFILGPQEAADLWRARQDFEAVLVLEDGNIQITAGLEESFTPGQGYAHREVTVIRP